jgi:hypothetical protein
MKTIQYGIDKETGCVISRINNKIAIPVLQYNDMKPENNFKTSYELEKFDIFSIINYLNNNIKWTKKISKNIKNIHRQFWGLKLLN